MRERERKRKKERVCACEREGESVCVCVCVCERERDIVTVRVAILTARRAKHRASCIIKTRAANTAPQVIAFPFLCPANSTKIAATTIANIEYITIAG